MIDNNRDAPALPDMGRETGMEPFRFRAMNTAIEVAIRTGSKAVDRWEPASRQHEWMEWALHWFRSVEDRFSRFKTNSELAHVNRSAGWRCLVSESMLEVLQLTEEWRRKTDGMFDPFILKALQGAGYDETFDLIRKEGMRQAVLPSLPHREGKRMDLDPGMKAVLLAPGEQLDLSGIVKSWAVERFAEWLRTQWAMPAGMVNAGGDLTVWGSAAEPWWIGIEHPWQPDEEIGVLALARGAAATSSKLGRKWQTDRGPMHHLIDPRTMRPSASDTVQCTVSGPSAVDCEIWAKTVCIAGSEDGLAMMKRKAPGYEAIVFTEAEKTIFYGQRESLETRWIDMKMDEIIESEQ